MKLAREWKGVAASMLDFLQPIFPFAFAILWFGGTFALIIYQRMKFNAYIHQLPPGTFVLPPEELRLRYNLKGNLWSQEHARRLGEAERIAPPDSARERLRRAAGWSGILIFVWGFGFPLVTFAVIGLLTVAGLVHPH